MRSSLAASSLLLAAVAFLAAGCGGGSTPSVASLGTTGSDTTAEGGPAPSGPGNARVFGVNAKDAAQFSACMRSHGVPNFPDPDSSGGIKIGPGSGFDPNSPTSRKALQACQKLLPNGGQPTPQQIAKMQQAALAFSACMRRHGLPDFPDPDFSQAGGIGIRIHIGNGDLNPSSPAFQAAQRACRNILPGKPRGG